MKKLNKLLVLTFAVILHMNCAGQEFYYNFEEHVYIDKVTDKILVTFDEALTEQQQIDIISSVNNVSIALDPLPDGHGAYVPRFRTISINPADFNEISEALQVFDEVDYVMHLYAQSGQVGCEECRFGITNEVSLKLVDAQYENELADYLQSIGCPAYKRSNLAANKFIAICPKELSSIDVSNAIYELGYCEYASPNFIFFNATASNDPHYALQWNLENTGQGGGTPGIDIDIVGAHNITKGSSEIKMAIVDAGVQLNHEDLQQNLLPGFDASGGNYQGGIVCASCLDAHHGTSVAGIAGALTDNQLGIAGIAGGCKIIPIGLATIPIQAIQLSDAILWAVNNNADVINLSLFLNTPDPGITAEINNATSNGRNGLGTVVVACSGNNGKEYEEGNNPYLNPPRIYFPAFLHNIISVGAVDRNGNRWISSNYGSDLDVTAPFDVYTCHYDNKNAGANNLYAYFGGTSSATPHVTGIAALILSLNPCLTYLEVQDVIESTAQKVGNYTYHQGKPNGTWNIETGYGLVNAKDALEYVVRRMYLQNNMVNTPTPQIHDEQNFIYAGANVDNSANPGNYIVQPPGHVECYASHSIHLEDGFEAAGGSVFIAEIEPLTCEGIGPGGGENPAGKPGKTTKIYDTILLQEVLEEHNSNTDNSEALNQNGVVKVFPNPNSGSFTVQLPQQGTYELQVVDIVGTIVYKATITDQQRSTIQLDEQLSAGNYTLQINGEGIRHIEKLTIMK